MTQRVRPFSDEQARALINLRPRYETVIQAQRELAALPYNLVRKRVGDREYLYEVLDRANNGRSLGPMSPELERRLADYRTNKQALKLRIATAQERIEEIGRLARPLNLPRLPSPAGQVLRELDRRRLLDGTVLVVGTNCMLAYALAAAGAITGAPDETDDFDLAWTAGEPLGDAVFWNALRAVDPTYTVNTERTFQARNSKAYEVELLAAQSRAHTMAPQDRPRPMPLRGQQWLLLGRPVDEILPCRDGNAARLVVPDPRWFALHKLWLSDQPERSPLKVRKDRRQGLALLDAVAETMPHYPLDAAFEASIPAELAPYWAEWRARRELN
jgi:hypothetical protein